MSCAAPVGKAAMLMKFMQRKQRLQVIVDELAPRNFKATEDQGIITVRYVLQNVAPDRFRSTSTAVFVENETALYIPRKASWNQANSGRSLSG